MKQYYTAPTRRIRIINGEDNNGQIVYTIREKEKKNTNTNTNTDTNQDLSIIQEKKDINSCTSTPPEYASILDNSDCVVVNDVTPQ